MTDEPVIEPGATVPPEDLAAGPPTVPPGDAAKPSTELVVPERRPLPAPARRWPDAVLRARGRLLQLRQHPAAVLSVSAAATVGSALLSAGLRRALRQAALSPASPAGRTTSVAVRGYVLHEVHVFHHVVHHVVRPPTQS